VLTRSGYAGKSSHKIISFSASDGEKVAVGRMRYPRFANGFPDGGAGGKRAAHGGEGRGLGIRPAPEFHRGQVRGGLHGGENDVGTPQHRTEFVRIVDVDLKFGMELNRLVWKGEPGGLARLAHAMQQQGEVGLLRKGEVAGLALGNFLAGDVGWHFAEGRGGLGEIIGGQARGDLGIFLRGGNDEVAIVNNDGDWAVRFMWHNQFLVVILSFGFELEIRRLRGLHRLNSGNPRNRRKSADKGCWK